MNKLYNHLIEDSSKLTTSVETTPEIDIDNRTTEEEDDNTIYITDKHL